MKTEITNNLEKKLYISTRKIGTFGCFEVTIGGERVDFLTCDTQGIWRCYEIKATKADFFSPAAKTFVGNYNYYVMPDSLYDQVKDDIPCNIGVHNGNYVIKKPKRVPLGVDDKLLSSSMIRSLYRDADKLRKMEDGITLDRLRRDIKNSQIESREFSLKYNHLYCAALQKYGRESVKAMMEDEFIYEQ